MQNLLTAFYDWLQLEWRALRAPILWIAVGFLIAIATLSAQFSYQYVIDVGYEEGIGNADLSFLNDFNTPEESRNGHFRWTGGDSKIFLPALGVRPTLIELRWLPIGESIRPQVSDSYQVWVDELLITESPVWSSGSRQWFILPATVDGHLRIRIVSNVFQPAQDLRQLGLPLERIVIASVPGGWVWPALPLLVGWIGAVILGWLILFRTIHKWAGWGLVIGLTAISLAIILDPVRWAFGAEAAVAALALTYVLTLAVQFGLRRLPIDHHVRSPLSAIVAIAFATRIAGRFYPASMPGDIGFHTNRFHEALSGLITIVSKNRGIEFPYPPGPYLLLAPLRVLGIETPLLLQIGAALADTLARCSSTSLLTVFGLHGRHYWLRQSMCLLPPPI